MSEIIRSNIMQRLFDALPPPESESMLTVQELSITLRFGPATIGEALRRLRRLRCIRSACEDGEWKYGQRKGARRPADSRGRKREP